MTRTDSSNPPLSAAGGSTPRLPDDDVSAPELWSALTNRKGVILAILLISLITAGLFIFFTPPVYESRAVLQIGMIDLDRKGQWVLIEPPAVLTKRLMVQDDMDGGKTAVGKVRPFIQTAFLEKDTDLISIIARGPAPDATQEYLAQVVARVIHEHQKLFDLTRKEQQESLNLLQMHGHGLNQEIAANEEEISILARQPASADAIDALRVDLAQEKSKLLEQRRLVEQQQKNQRMAMSALRSKPTTLIKAPALTADPVKPRPLLYFAFAMGIGLMLGIFSALVIEFIGKMRRSASS